MSNYPYSRPPLNMMRGTNGATVRGDVVNAPNGGTGSRGPAGVAGTTGATGDTGAAGAAGADGADGATGPMGPSGATGATGATGSTGPAGADGADGAVGPAGPTGPDGPTGPKGDQGDPGPKGDPGDKMAIVPTRQGADQNVALFCLEAPTPIFMDFYSVPSGDFMPIDERFVDAVEPLTMRVVAIVPPIRTNYAGHIEQHAEGWRVYAEADGQMILQVTIIGTRKGRHGVRFPVKSDVEMAANNAFWDGSKPQLKLSQIEDLRGQ